VIEYFWSWWLVLREFLAENLTFIDVLDIVLVTIGVYWLLSLIRGTRAVQVILGFLLLIATYGVAQFLSLPTLTWVLDNFLQSAVLIAIVLFQNDIRRALARVGRGFSLSAQKAQQSQILEEIVRAAQLLSQRRVGALIVLERETGLEDLIEAGTRLDAEVSKDLLASIFMPTSPLHDGAVVIQGGRVALAGCILPLTLREDLPEGVGTRHRAAVGITEETDAVVVVVSEETSGISVVAGGQLRRDLDAPRLRGVLRDLLAAGPREPEAGAGDPAAPDAASPEADASAVRRVG
jgi:uncharacterized protein (TIGR00159 family)